MLLLKNDLKSRSQKAMFYLPALCNDLPNSQCKIKNNKFIAVLHFFFSNVIILNERALCEHTLVFHPRIEQIITNFN